MNNSVATFRVTCPIYEIGGVSLVATTWLNERQRELHMLVTDPNWSVTAFTDVPSTEREVIFNVDTAQEEPDMLHEAWMPLAPPLTYHDLNALVLALKDLTGSAKWSMDDVKISHH